VDRSLRLAHQIAAAPRIAVHWDPATRKPLGFMERQQSLEQYRGREDVFGSLTSIPKLGINPGSSYKTPIGIYSYPVDYLIGVYDISLGGFDVPYPPKERQAYVQVFSVDTSRCLQFRKGENSTIKAIRDSVAPDDIKTQKAVLKESIDGTLDYYQKNWNDQERDRWFFEPETFIDNLYGVDVPYEVIKMFRTFFSIDNWRQRILESGEAPDPALLWEQINNYYAEHFRSQDDLPFEKYFKKLYFMVQPKSSEKKYRLFLKSVLGSDQRVYSDQAFVWNATRHLSGFNPAKWTSLLVQLGFIGAIDYGTRQIHDNEPTQAVFFSRAFVTPLDSIVNQRPQYEEGGSEAQRTLQGLTRAQESSVGGSFIFDTIRSNINHLDHIVIEYLKAARDSESEYTRYYSRRIEEQVSMLRALVGWLLTHRRKIDFKKQNFSFPINIADLKNILASLEESHDTISVGPGIIKQEIYINQLIKSLESLS
jgi:hypothetical protein